MNVEHLKELRDAIAASDTYDQLNVRHDCGSPACIAGHGAILAYNKGINRCLNAIDATAVFIGADRDEIHRIIRPTPFAGRIATKSDAIGLLNYAIHHDVIQWHWWLRWRRLLWWKARK